MSSEPVRLPDVAVMCAVPGNRPTNEVPANCATLDGETDLSQAALREPLALVLGAEGKGLRQLTAQTCDIRARLDLPGAIKSLNVSNAAAVALYAAAAVLTARA